MSSGLTIQINGKAYGRTPLSKSIILKPGDYSVVLKKGSKRKVKKVKITAGGSHKLAFGL